MSDTDPELGSFSGKEQQETREATLTSPQEIQSLRNVDWDGDNDPENPQNWSTFKKTVNIGIVSILAFIT